MYNTRARLTKNKTLKSSDIPIYRIWVMHYGEENYRRELDGYVQSRTQSWDVHK